MLAKYLRLLYLAALIVAAGVVLSRLFDAGEWVFGASGLAAVFLGWALAKVRTLPFTLPVLHWFLFGTLSVLLLSYHMLNRAIWRVEVLLAAIGLFALALASGRHAMIRFGSARHWLLFGIFIALAAALLLVRTMHNVCTTCVGA